MLAGLLAVADDKIAPPERAATPREIAKVKTYFNEALKDAPAARWRFEGVWPGGFVCGTINAKNSFGAYTGWHRFWYHEGDGDISDEDRQSWTIRERIPCLLPPFITLDEALKPS